MRKYIITPALLAIVCMVMCHCTFNRKASVAANEYLIQGELANLPDSIVIGLYEEDGNILNCVLRDTLMNGQFSFRDTVSTTRKMLIMSDNRGFPGTWLEVWIAPGEYIEIKGQDKLQYRPPESSNKQVARWFRFSSLVTKSKSFLSGFQVSMESAIPTHIVPLIEATVYTFDFRRHENFCVWMS